MGIYHQTQPPPGATRAVGQTEWAQAHVLDASGITFADGTTQTTAATGSGGATTYTTLAYAATLTPASASRAYWRVIMTGNVTIELPTSPTDGDRAYFWLTASGASYTVSLNAAIVIPTSSVTTFPQTIQSGAKARLMIEYDATRAKWELVSWINGY